MTFQQLLRRVFIENAYYKFFSLALVTLLYIWVLGDRDSEITLNTPLRLAVPADMVLVNQPQQTVELTLSGRWTALERLSASNNLPPLLVDLEGRAGEEIVRLNESMVQLPPGLRVKAITPAFISTSLQPREEKRVNITPRFIGELPQGFQLGQIKISPSTTTITGPSDLVAKISAVQTEAIDLSSRRETFAAQVPVQHNSSFVRDELQDLVQVSVGITSLEMEKTFTGIKIVAVNTSLDTQITPPTLDVTLRGPKKLIEGFDPKSLLVSIDMSAEEKLPAGLFKKSVAIGNLPRDLEKLSHYPTDFQVRTSRPQAPEPQ